MTALQKTLSDIQLRLSVAYGRQLTHKDLAKISCASTRALGEWMRGSTAPGAMISLLNLLSHLKMEDVEVVLNVWKQANELNHPELKTKQLQEKHL